MQLIDDIIRDVAELPDRTSPDDQPDMMLVTAEELEVILRARLDRDQQRLDCLRDESWDLRCFPVPTGGDDADIGWRVIGHWMAEPCERVMGEVYHDDPRAAIDDAMQRRGNLNVPPQKRG